MRWWSEAAASFLTSVSLRHSAALQGGCPRQGDGLFALPRKTIYFWKRWWVSHPSSFLFFFGKKILYFEGHCCLVTLDLISASFFINSATFLFSRCARIFLLHSQNTNFSRGGAVPQLLLGPASGERHCGLRFFCFVFKHLTILQVSLNTPDVLYFRIPYNIP